MIHTKNLNSFFCFSILLVQSVAKIRHPADPDIFLAGAIRTIDSDWAWQYQISLRDAELQVGGR